MSAIDEIAEGYRFLLPSATSTESAALAEELAHGIEVLHRVQQEFLERLSDEEFEAYLVRTAKT